MDAMGKHAIHVYPWTPWVDVEVFCARAVARPLLTFRVQARPLGAVCTLRQAATREAFFDMQVTDLRLLAGHFKCEIASGATTYELVESLVMQCLPGATEEDLYVIMSKRLLERSLGLDELMQIDEVLDVMDKDDVREVAECKKKAVDDLAIA